MNLDYTQTFSLIGALLQLVVYGLMQTNKIKVESYLYQSFNTIGSFIMASVSLYIMNYGFLLMEGTWFIISAYGLFKTIKMNNINPNVNSTNNVTNMIIYKDFKFTNEFIEDIENFHNIKFTDISRFIDNNITRLMWLKPMGSRDDNWVYSLDIDYHKKSINITRTM